MSPEQVAGWQAAFRYFGWGDAESRREDLRQAIAAHGVCAAHGADIPIEAFMLKRPSDVEPEAKPMTPAQEAKVAENQIKHMKASALAKHLGEQGFTHEEIATALAELFK